MVLMKVNGKPYIRAPFEIVRVMPLRHMYVKVLLFLHLKDKGALGMECGMRIVSHTGIPHILPWAEQFLSTEILSLIGRP